MKLLIVLAVLALPAAAAETPSITFPESEAKGIHGSEGMCSVHAFDVSIALPTIAVDKRPSVPENWKQFTRDAAADARARLMGARRLLDRMQLAQQDVILATNRCDGIEWTAFVDLSSAASSAVMDGVAPSMAMFDRSDEPVTWKTESYRLREKGPPPALPAASDRFAASCRAPELDADLYAPEGPGLAFIADSASKVTAALIEQKAALDALLPLMGGRRCREVLEKFDAMVKTERRFYFEYREHAVAASVWGGLKWRKAAPSK